MFYFFCGSYITWDIARYIVGTSEIYNQVMGCRYLKSSTFSRKEYRKQARQIPMKEYDKEVSR